MLQNPASEITAAAAIGHVRLAKLRKPCINVSLTTPVYDHNTNSALAERAIPTPATVGIFPFLSTRLSWNWDNYDEAAGAGEKPLYWVGSSLKDLREFPLEVRTSVGFALSAAQFGGKHPSAKPWKGEGPGMMEVVTNHDGDTFRAVYTIRFSQAVYVLHVFQKKSPRGIAIRLTDVALIRQRLQVARRDYEERHG